MERESKMTNSLPFHVLLSWPLIRCIRWSQTASIHVMHSFAKVFEKLETFRWKRLKHDFFFLQMDQNVNTRYNLPTSETKRNETREKSKYKWIHLIIRWHTKHRQLIMNVNNNVKYTFIKVKAYKSFSCNGGNRNQIKQESRWIFIKRTQENTLNGMPTNNLKIQKKRRIDIDDSMWQCGNVAIAKQRRTAESVQKRQEKLDTK